MDVLEKLRLPGLYFIGAELAAAHRDLASNDFAADQAKLCPDFWYDTGALAMTQSVFQSY